MSRSALARVVAGSLFVISIPSIAAQTDDPYVWLEGVDDKKALEWVGERNKQSHDQLEGDLAFQSLKTDLRAILDSDDKIPFVNKMGEHYYNFWKDKDNARGVWRRTTPAEYAKADPTWEVLIDLDALNKAEGENWVWHGSSCLRPEKKGDPYRHCLVSLSRGGADADVTREFDLVSKQWVKDGYFRPEAKGGLSWIDRDTVYVNTDFGDGSMTSSGYPRIVKEWKRGTPMAEARTVFEGELSDISVGAYHDDTPGYERDFVYRGVTFYTNELYLRGKDGKLVRLDLPDGASKNVYREWLTLELRQPWSVGGRDYTAGSLLAIDFDAFLEGQRNFDVLFEPTDTTSLSSYGATKDYYYLNVLDDVKNRIWILTHGEDGWKREPLVGAPAFGTVGISAVDPEESNEYFLTVTDYLTPTSLQFGRIGEAPKTLKQQPAFFDASGLQISQHFARSKDGTRVPYFLVSRKDIELDGSNPTLLYGYGGFEISLTPGYSAGVGRGWLSQGGTYAVANIRGGGEYGEEWHHAGMFERKQNVFDDFIAAGEYLVREKYTSPDKLAINGGSNGGLLVGAVMTQRPELFGVAVPQVGVLDMLRYNAFTGGAAWATEYGASTDSAAFRYLRAYSPLHNVKPGVCYPATLLTTADHDDRVVPSHSFKFAAALQAAQGCDKPVLIRVEVAGSHGYRPTDKLIAERADQWAFAAHHMGMK
jgi:prolyl oligopeptidase